VGGGGGRRDTTLPPPPPSAEECGALPLKITLTHTDTPTHPKLSIKINEFVCGEGEATLVDKNKKKKEVGGGRGRRRRRRRRGGGFQLSLVKARSKKTPSSLTFYAQLIILFSCWSFSVFSSLPPLRLSVLKRKKCFQWPCPSSCASCSRLSSTGSSWKWDGIDV